MKPGTLLNIAASALIGAGAVFATVGATTTALMMTSTTASAQNVDRYRPGADSGKRANRAERRGNRAERRTERRSERRTERRTERRANRSERRGNRAERRGNRAERRSNRVERRRDRVRSGHVDRIRSGQADRGFRYKRNRHGRRYHTRRRGYDHFYNGFYYSSPFWLGAVPYYSYSVSDWDAHVAWCHDRYRSYDERRDAFKGYDGLWHKCNSPYG